MNYRYLLITTSALLLLLCFSPSLTAQKKAKKKQDKSTTEKADEINLNALTWRCVGPALTSGRIADIAVHPEHHKIQYVATASGGVWKTVNHGTTYKPITDGQGSYSMGCVTLDPSQPNTVWVGSGENNNQRSVAYGDGIYRSDDAGASWKHMGLKESEHIGRIIVHPENSDVIYVAAIGPLWSSGGDRGVYRSQDGGDSWQLVLEIDEHTGVNDIVMHPTDPDILYASSLQRRRHVYTYVGGGPGSSMYRSIDGGDTWDEIKKGLPSAELGRIGLAVTSAAPDRVYAIVEAAEGKGGFYMSDNRGANWNRQSGQSTSGNYYQEIITDPLRADVIYSMDTWMKVSTDAGKSWSLVGEDTKHVDNHSMWIDPEDGEHWIVGCDGGIYETYDAADTWAFRKNLPVTQFYKVAVDNDEPFYNIYGGTQDNFSIGGPSRVTNSHGIRNEDWFITHGGDGFETQIDPENPDIIYAQSQYGVLVRYDRRSGEELGIQPKERKGEDGYRWNWDAPLIASPHSSGRVYFAANKVFKSDDYGNSWDVISDDLTRQLNRNELPVYDRVVSIDAVMKNGSTSPYGTIVAMSESAIDADVLAIGTDDGLIQITEDAGATWRSIENLPGAPARSYVNSVYLSQHDRSTIYAALNHHKYGDFTPYIYVSRDLGSSWNRISTGLPDRGSVYAIEEDHEKAELLFCGTEFGVFYSATGGSKWSKLGSGLPTVAVRDIAIQKRENDLILGTFGRGFYVLDDYSVLRGLSPKSDLAEDGVLAVRDPLMWEKDAPLGLPGKSFQGDDYYTAENLGPVALIRYHYSKEHKSLEDKRKKAQKEAVDKEVDFKYPDYDALAAERDEASPKVVFTITDSDGNYIHQIQQSASKGLGSLEWNLRYHPTAPIDLSSPSFYNPFAGKNEGTLVVPGEYTVQMSSYHDGKSEDIGEPFTFTVKALDSSVMPARDRAVTSAFQREVEAFGTEISVLGARMREANNKLRYMREAAKYAQRPWSEITAKIDAVEEEMDELNRMLYGDNIMTRLDMGQPVTPAARVGWISYESKYSTSDPTETHQMSLAIAKEEFMPIKVRADALFSGPIADLEKLLDDAGAPYTPGRG